MKKTAFSPPLPAGVKKMFLLMRLTVFLILIATLHVSARTYSQQKLSVSFEKISLTKALKVVEKKTDYRFVFSNKVLTDKIKVTLEAKDILVEDLLEELLRNTGLTYGIMGNNLVVIKKNDEILALISVTGKVRDKDGKGIPNVNVTADNGTGTITNEDGGYTIKVDQSGFLIFSYVGFLSQKIQVNNRNVIDVILQSGESKLDEVVVVGYNTQVKRSLTSAVATVSGAELNKRVQTNPATLLQGQLPGLQVVQNSGQPGNENVSLLIRGVGTFSGAGTNPLIIVDGLPGSLTVLNPNDIESVSVLKDAASAAIYGSRGANGVIVIKTKKGRTGSGFSVTYNYNLGISKATKLPSLVTNSATFMDLSNEARLNSGLQPLYTQAQIDLYKNATDRVKYPNHNWLNDVFRTAYTPTHYLNMSGGAENTNYSLGIGYADQDGVMIGFSEKKYTMDFGLSSRVNKRITIGTNIQMRYSHRLAPENGGTDMFLSTLAQSPLYPPRTADGLWIKKAYSNELNNKNTVAIVAEDAVIRYDDYYAQGNLSLDVDILNGLKWENRAGMNFDAYKYNDFRPVVQTYYYNDLSPAGILDDGTPGLNVGRSDNIYTVYYSQLNYKKQFGEHNIGVLGGFQQEYNGASNIDASRTQFPTNDLRELNAGPTNGQTNDGTSFAWAIRSFYGNANYSFQDKYLLGASIRYDGTSRLPSDSRWGLFYSFSGGWRISKENFLKDISWLNDLKIRASWGQLGNQNIGTYPYQPTLDNRSYVFGTTVQTGFSASTLVDPSLTWETTRVVDAGLDLTVLNNRLSFTGDWFNKYTFDILRSSQVPLWLGLNAPTINDGALRNTGFELQAQYRDIIGKDFSWTAGGNIQAYKNKLEQFGKTEIGYNTIREEGKPLDGFYLYQWDGIFQSQEEIDKSPAQPVTPTPGDLKFKDVNGDGVINDQDRVYTPGRYPSFQYAFNVGAAYKGFDLSAQFYGSKGQKIYVTGWGIEPFLQGSVPTTDWLNSWTPQNHSTTLPKIYVADGYPAVQNYASSYFLKNASYLRLKNIQIGYTIPVTITHKAGIKSLRIYFSAENVFTSSKFPGLDPERVSASSTYVSYPQNKTFNFGASVQF